MKEVMAYSALSGSLWSVFVADTRRDSCLSANEDCCGAAFLAVLVITTPLGGATRSEAFYERFELADSTRATT
jgi:hypothetical protein